MLAEAPEPKLEALFEHYVGRNFATREYQERLLENGIRRLLYRADLPFGPAIVGDEVFTVNFPFVRKDGDRVTSVIKPLFLAQDDSTAILTKGDGWIGKLKRLRPHQALPERVLFALESPPTEADRRFQAFMEIRDELIDEGVSIAEASNDAGQPATAQDLKAAGMRTRSRPG